MSVLQTITDVKIPYASEGVIRTAQVDDTVSPENSVQLAVNMNFDRVGAIQTRQGVEQYADDLADSIKNFGTLRNSIVPPGYEFLAQLGTTTTVSNTTFEEVALVKVSDTKAAMFWSGPDGDGFCQNVEVDLVTGEMTPIGTPVEFDTGSASHNKAILIAPGLVLNVWTGVDSDGFARVFNVSADTIVPTAAALEFDASSGSYFTLAQVDSTHVICFYKSTSDDGIATIFAIDLGTGAVTEPGSPLTFDSGSVFDSACVALGDGTHFINFWNGGDGFAQVFTVNTGTWAITAEGTPFTFDTIGALNDALSCGDGEHFVNVFQGSTGGRFEAQVFNVNLSTFAVTEVGTPVLISTGAGGDLAATALDDEHFVVAWSESSGNGYVQMIEMDPLTFDLSVVGMPLAGYDYSGSQRDVAIATLDATHAMVLWATVSNLSGKAAMFSSFGDVVEGSWLYAASGDEVFNTPAPGGTWTSRRSGLSEVGKPRFAQYLNYIWMVNGNEIIGGNPVATSNGGDFGDDLVPEDFPAGDFISAGFEGRVWIANKTLGVIQYSDIVQFIPPATYNLTYNQEVNYISTLAPQTGQTFTALFEVPRALLVFTEDTITRIYGASSVDAYPAYNVGTYSQESIVETKTGIFFHHSSGFYQFDYGSQPVEISRRIIDFVKAIPRANYDDIVGVYDGFDTVKWYVGQVVVEGVVFSNCCVRYTISTQVWTIYDYKGIDITALITYDDGTAINQIVGAMVDDDPDPVAKTGTLDTGNTDFGVSFYYEFIDRWRPYTNMYYLTKTINEVSVYSENAAGANLMYQVQKSGPNAWLPFGTVTEVNNSILANKSQEDFDVMRWRLAGNTKGAQVVVHGIEVISLTIKGQEEN